MSGARDSRRCDFCGKSISATAFESGRAVQVARRIYCADCMKRAIEQSRKPDVPPELRTPPPGPPT